ncbi:MAG: hypothetical protein PW788_05090 [Micavibrio sp.]|nr:hypothetical protein [Micavibrio sp.]
MSGQARIKKNVTIFLVIALALNVVVWLAANKVFAKWEGVPPVPTRSGAISMGLGDAEFAYRFGAITLQNLGDGGGQTTALKDYDYKALGNWFWLLNSLDPASDHVPMLAAYYFGGTLVPADVRVVYDYLSVIGNNPAGQKWRWLVHAIFLARHRLYDVDLALNLAYKLSKMELVDDRMPVWARQMPALVLAEKGEKEDARRIVENLLMSSDKVHPNEIGYMEYYLTHELGVDPAEVKAIKAMRGKEADPANLRETRAAPMPQ